MFRTLFSISGFQTSCQISRKSLEQFPGKMCHTRTHTRRKVPNGPNSKGTPRAQKQNLGKSYENMAIKNLKQVTDGHPHRRMERSEIIGPFREGWGPKKVMNGWTDALSNDRLL